MINRIKTGWTFTRILYLSIGVFVMIQSLTDQMWAGVAFGAYFASMGLFAFGCASGNCHANTPANQQKTELNTMDSDIQYEEVK